MTNRLRTFAVLGSCLLGLAACSSGSNTPTTPVPTPTPTPTPPTPKVEDQFGACFATRFRADPNSKATDPVPCPDLPPVSATAKPAQI